MALTDPIRTVTSNEQEPNAEMAALLSSDLLLQIGDAELCSTMPTTSETNRRLYEMVLNRIKLVLEYLSLALVILQGDNKK